MFCNREWEKGKKGKKGREGREREREFLFEFQSKKRVKWKILNTFILLFIFIEAKQNKKKRKKEFQEEEGDQILRHWFHPPLANCPFDIGINLSTHSCSSSSSYSSPLNMTILFSL